MLLLVFGSLICILMGDQHGWPEDQSRHNIVLDHTFFFLCPISEVIDLANFIGNLATSQISITNLMFINNLRSITGTHQNDGSVQKYKINFLFFVSYFIR